MNRYKLKNKFLGALLAIWLGFRVGPVQAETEENKNRFEVFSVSEKSYSSSRVEDPADNNFEKDLKLGVSLFEAALSLPLIPNKEGAYFIHGLNFSRLDLEYENWDQGQDPDLADRFYAIEYRFIYRSKLSDQDMITFLASPGISSDMEAITADSLRVMLGFILERTYENKNTLGIGIGYVSNFNEPLFFPLMSFSARLGGPLKLRMVLPRTAELRYEYSRTLDFGLAVRYYANKYRITEPGMNSDLMTYQNATIGPELSWMFAENWALNLESGMTFFHRVSLYESDRKRRALDFKNSGYFNLGISYKR